MNSLGGIKYALTSGRNEILLDRKLGEAAKLPLQRMLDFAAGLKRGGCVQRYGPRLIFRPYCHFRRPLKQGQHHANRLRRIDRRKRAGGTDARPVAA